MKDRDTIAIIVVVFLVFLSFIIYCVVKYRQLLAQAMNSGADSGPPSKSSFGSSEV